MSETAAMDAGVHPLRWAATRGVVARAVFGARAVCPYGRDSLAARCWLWGLRFHDGRRSVSRETTGKRPKRQPRWTDEDREALCDLLAAGFKHGEIAVILGRSYEGIEGQIKTLRKAGVLERAA